MTIDHTLSPVRIAARCAKSDRRLFAAGVREASAAIAILLGCLGSLQTYSATVTYSVAHAALTGGGARVQSVGFTLDTSLEDFGGLASSTLPGITVRPGFAGQLNDAPVAVSSPVAVTPGAVTVLRLMATDVELDFLRFRIVSGPAFGTLTGAGRDLVYTPGSSFVASDQFAFVVDDGLSDSAPATITLLAGVTTIRLREPHFINATELQIELEGRPNACYRAETSNDLMQWRTLANGSANAAGVFTFTDRRDGNAVGVFYRVVEVPCGAFRP